MEIECGPRRDGAVAPSLNEIYPVEHVGRWIYPDELEPGAAIYLPYGDRTVEVEDVWRDGDLIHFNGWYYDEKKGELVRVDDAKWGARETNSPTGQFWLWSIRLWYRDQPEWRRLEAN